MNKQDSNFVKPEGYREEMHRKIQQHPIINSHPAYFHKAFPHAYQAMMLEMQYKKKMRR